MQKLNLVTVVGHNITMLPHMINHYKDMVDEIYVVVYKQHNNDGIEEQVRELGINPYLVVTEPKFNWEKVTELYNQVKQTKPDEWWIVSDDDEFHVYPKPIREMIEECEENGWDFITGGFLDRIGPDGTFPVITNESNIWEEFTNCGFFRNPMSGACPNKVCVMKGSVDVTGGQHYVSVGDSDTWRERGWNHPKRYPPKKGFVQVHHFKWDSSVLKRLQDVANTKTDYSYWKEYKKMYRNIQLNNFRIDINNKNYYIVPMSKNTYDEYPYWKIITQKIIEI
jgi:hypothetical protein